jgi:O-antigen/teichoic acid export membrane protein
VVIPVLVTVFFSKPIVFTFAGYKYESSVNVLKFLSLAYLYSFISYATMNLLIAKEKIKTLVVFYSMMPVFYWGIIFLFLNKMNILIFPVSKFIVNTYILIFYFYAIRNILKIKIHTELFKMFKQIIIPVALIILLSLYLSSYMPIVKNKFNFFIVALNMGIIIIVGFICYYITCFEFRDYIKTTLDKIRVRFKG